MRIVVDIAAGPEWWATVSSDDSVVSCLTAPLKEEILEDVAQAVAREVREISPSRDGTAKALESVKAVYADNAKLRQHISKLEDALAMVVQLPDFQRTYPDFAAGIRDLLDAS